MKKALELLEDVDACYDLHHALILCKMTNFRPGILLLLERLKL